MKNKFFKFLALSLAATLLLGTTVCADDSSDYVHVDVFGSVYYGTLTTAKDGKNSVFTTVPESDSQFTITGKWDTNTSAFTQKCTIAYSDGSSQSIEYNKKGLIQGDIRTDFPDGSYQTFSTASGKPYKALRTFSSSDELTAIDWYYKCTLMSTWKSDAGIANYDALMETPYEYIDLPFTVKGTVEAIYEDSNNHTDIKIKDDDGNCYTSREEEIIDRYLLQEESLEIDVFDMSNYDISTICYVANCGLNFTNESFRMVIHEILLCVIDIWKYTKRNYNAHEIFDVYQEHEIIELFQWKMIQTQDDAKMAIDILFEEIDFTKFTTDTIEFYQDIFGNFLCEFFDSYVDSKRRNICKKKILYIEKKVNDIDEEYVRIQLYKSLMLSVTRYCTGDWSKIKTNYSYVDKQFLNKQFTKYGKYHIKELLRTIYQMHMDELLPEILISIRNSFQNAKSEVNKFKKSIREQEAIVQLIILKSFITYSDKIKQDQELIEAYEDILEILINLNYEQAAVILDEFRIH